MAAVPLGAFDDIFSQADNVDVKLGSIKVDGKREKLTHGRYSFFLQHKDQAVRKAAFKTYYKGYIDLINTLTAIYSGNVKKDNFLARARGFKSCKQMKTFYENVPEKVYDNLIYAVNKNLPTMHEYVALRKKVLGVDTLNMYDMYVPITSTDLSVDFDEAFEMVKSGLKPLGEEYAKLLQCALDERWMDVYETENKRSGAYSSGCYGTKPFVLLNYSATVHDIFTIAHELGHSIHTYYSAHTQPYAKSGYEIFVAEVASTVNEVLLLKDMLAKAKDKELKKFLLSYYLDMFRTTLFRQTMFAEFEKIAHELDDNGEALTPDALNKRYYKLNKKYYGKAVKHNKEIAYEWARIPHFYSSFYVYKYATGITSAVSIAKNILSTPGYFDKYKKFLCAGGSESPYEILKLTGVDLCSQKPFDDAMEEMKTTLEELGALCED
jgi:oligoendopeptidase F